MIMYRDLVEKNLEAARRNEKKESPALTIFVFVVGALFGLNAFGLFAKGRGIILRSLGPELCGALSALLCLACLYTGVRYLAGMVKNRNEGATAKRMERFTAAVRAIGPEDEVYSELEALTPYVFPNGELRFDQKLIAGTSDSNVDGNYVFPMQALKAAGLSRLGGNIMMYLHIVSRGKKHKHSYTVSSEEAGAGILEELKALQPSLTVKPLEGK